jgi:hypothetical protein
MPLPLGCLIIMFKTHKLPCQHVYKSFVSYKRPLPTTKLQDANILKVLIYLTRCLRRNLD